ncbi:hypothetical protein CC80DRAFT_595202 [Byssothecium circinans]|uniref:Rhodopsin domain-containing protein n=1 Tax=Byssothecium circinans TaxID=147558 RepID=A0A6A5TTL2_9PLEO|nr:hypothetical protein CC80DRAFT_595202 [Byssothecium circinans]
METISSISNAAPTGGSGQPDSTPMAPQTNQTMMQKPSCDANRFPNVIDNTTQAPILLGLGGALVCVSLLLITARVWSRIRPSWRLKMDDWAILGGVILAVAQYVILAVSVLYGLGRRARFVSFARRRTSLRLVFISQLLWYWSLTLIKLSVALLLLRIKHTKRWRFFLYSTMLVLILAAVVQTAFQFLQCRPFSIYWDPRVTSTQGLKCFKTSVINGNIFAFSSIQIALDLTFSFVPILFIRKLNRPRREKVFTCVLMALGLLASCAAVIRTLAIQGVFSSTDLLRTNIAIAVWAVVEQHFAIIAATIPTLKAFMESSVVRAGLFFYDGEREGEMRAKLVAFGLLDEGDVLKKDENGRLRRRESWLEERMTCAGLREKGGVGMGKVVGFEEMVRSERGAGGKEFV